MEREYAFLSCLAARLCAAAWRRKTGFNFRWRRESLIARQCSRTVSIGFFINVYALCKPSGRAENVRIVRPARVIEETSFDDTTDAVFDLLR